MAADADGAAVAAVVVVAIAAANRAGNKLTNLRNGRGALLSRCCVQRVFKIQATEAREATESLTTELAE